MMKNSASGLRLANILGLLVAACLIYLPAVSEARPFQFRALDPEVVKRLPAESAAAYEAAVTEVDHINYEAAWQKLQEAITHAPESVELRFLAINFARYRGENASGVEAARNLDQAIEHAHAIETNSRASARDKRSAANILGSIDKDRKAIEVRDEARRTVGLKIAKAYGKEIYTTKGKSKEISQFEKAVKELTKPGSASDKATKAAAKALASGQKVPLPGEAMPPIEGGATELEPGKEITVPPPSSEMAPPPPAEPAASDSSAALPPPPVGEAPSAVGQESAPSAAAAGLAAPATTDVGPSGAVNPIAGDRVPLEAGSPDYTAAKEFVDTNIPTFMKNWNAEEVWPLLDQDFLAKFEALGAAQDPKAKFKLQPKQIVGMVFAMSADAVGPLKECPPATGTAASISTPSGPLVVAVLRTTVVFEKETAPLYVEVVKRADGWKIRDFNIKSELIKKAQGQMMGKMGGGGGLLGGGAQKGAAPAPAPAEPAPAPAAGGAANPFK